MLDVLAGHADIVGDLVDLIALFSPGQDASAAQAVNGRVVGIVRVNVPIVFLDLAGNPFLPAPADGAAFPSSRIITSPRLLNLRITLTSLPRTSTSQRLPSRPSSLLTIGLIARLAIFGSSDSSTSSSAAWIRCEVQDLMQNGRTRTSRLKPLVSNVFVLLRNGLIDQVLRSKALVHDVGPIDQHPFLSCGRYHRRAVCVERRAPKWLAWPTRSVLNCQMILPENALRPA
jgi:hypothetical protein